MIEIIKFWIQTFVYKFDRYISPIKPATIAGGNNDNSFTQLHMSGTFMEKSDLLKKALGF